jgi:hypothetical protein
MNVFTSANQAKVEEVAKMADKAVAKKTTTKAAPKKATPKKTTK